MTESTETQNDQVDTDVSEIESIELAFEEIDAVASVQGIARRC